MRDPPRGTFSVQVFGDNVKPHGMGVIMAMAPVLDLGLEFFGTEQHRGEPTDPVRTGFYVSLMDENIGDILVTHRYGDMTGAGYDVARRSRYHDNAARKVRKSFDSHVETSWDIRDERAPLPIYPGAVRMGKARFAISGLSSGHKDQAVVLVGGIFILPETHGTIGLTEEYARVIATRTEDSEFGPFLDFVRTRLQV